MSLSFDPKEEREYTEDQARELWAEARRMAKAGDCNFCGWRFPQDPDAIGVPGDFTGTTFSGTAVFQGATFYGSVDFREATFTGDADFRKTTFCEYADFTGTTFKGRAYFRRAEFGDCVFLPWPSRPLSKPRAFYNIRDEVLAYRLAKMVAQDHGAYQLVGKYHFTERCATNKHLFREGVAEGNPKQIGKALFELVFGQFLLGYGERPIRPLCVAGFVITLWAFFFWHMERIKPDKPNITRPCQVVCITKGSQEHSEDQPRSFWECCYFSIVTFTTLGYGDMRPTDDIKHRFLAGSEALLGVAVMALFVVSLARGYTR